MIRKYIFYAAVLVLNGCASTNGKQVDEIIVFEPVPPTSRFTSDVQRISELERQLAERQRQCQAEKRRLELTLKDNQKQIDELQKKLDSLLAIDRELRSRAKNR